MKMDSDKMPMSQGRQDTLYTQIHTKFLINTLEYIKLVL